MRSILLVGASLIALSTPALANEDVLRLSRDPANVVMPSITYDGWNYSSLDQINLSNIKRISLSWTLQIGILDSHEAPPLVIGNTMYVISPRPNFLYAFDLVQEGIIKWEYRPTLDPAPAGPPNCCSAPPRGLYYADGTLYFGTADGKVSAVSAASGEEKWRVASADAARGESMAGAGLVVGKQFLIGAGGEGARGRVNAHDLATGAKTWSFANMGPNADVGIGTRFQKNYPYLSSANPAQDTWFGDSWQRGGGATAGYFTYDPALGLFYYGSSTCAPVNPDYRRERGKIDLDAAGHLTAFPNNFCASQMARDATTGELVWAYNLTPQDMWGFDEPSVVPLIDIGTTKAAVKIAGNGLVYAWDRATGKLAGEPWMHSFEDVIKGPAFVDMQTGLPAYDVAKVAFTAVEDRRKVTPEDPAAGANPRPANYTGTEILFCPGGGARKWENDAYSPRTKLIYTHTSNSCAATVAIAGEYTPGQGYQLIRRAAGVTLPRKDVAGQATTVLSELKAIDPAGRKIAWARPIGDEFRSPQLVTAGDLVFKGNTANGAMEAYNALNGEPMWSFRSGSGFAQSPVTYLLGGNQYVAVVASSPAANTPVPINAAPDAAARFRRGGTTLYVFCLGGATCSATE